MEQMKNILVIEHWYLDDAMWNRDEPKERCFFLGTEEEWRDYVEGCQSYHGANISVISKRQATPEEVNEYNSYYR